MTTVCSISYNWLLRMKTDIPFQKYSMQSSVKWLLARWKYAASRRCVCFCCLARYRTWRRTFSPDDNSSCQKGAVMILLGVFIRQTNCKFRRTCRMSNTVSYAVTETIIWLLCVLRRWAERRCCVRGCFQFDSSRSANKTSVLLSPSALRSRLSVALFCI